MLYGLLFDWSISVLTYNFMPKRFNEYLILLSQSAVAEEPMDTEQCEKEVDQLVMVIMVIPAVSFYLLYNLQNPEQNFPKSIIQIPLSSIWRCFHRLYLDHSLSQFHKYMTSISGLILIILIINILDYLLINI